MIAPAFNSDSRLMMFAPHPDDESLACSIPLQRAARAEAAVRVVYVTDGDDNPWPQRLLERKWRLNAADHKRWGRLRRAEALAALRTLGFQRSSACFLALPDQKLTSLLTRDCESILGHFATIIADWAPTDILVPSISDTHPDHNALAVMLRIAAAEFLVNEPPVSMWSYVVHGGGPVFFHRAQKFRQSESEKVIKLRAIRCHKTQLKLSRKRFLTYAARPEQVLKLNARETTIADGSIQFFSRRPHTLDLKVKLSVRAVRSAEPTLFLLGHRAAGALQCVNIRLPVRSSDIEISDCATKRRLGWARYYGNAFAGELTIRIDTFSPAHALFLKLERRSWFFDEAGWIEIPPTLSREQIARGRSSAGRLNVGEDSLPAR
jgi:LmbE family N-acetylglucosaminyl deacetylase